MSGISSPYSSPPSSPVFHTPHEGADHPPQEEQINPIQSDNLFEEEEETYNNWLAKTVREVEARLNEQTESSTTRIDTDNRGATNNSCSAPAANR